MGKHWIGLVLALVMGCQSPLPPPQQAVTSSAPTPSPQVTLPPESLMITNLGDYQRALCRYGKAEGLRLTIEQSQILQAYRPYVLEKNVAAESRSIRAGEIHFLRLEPVEGSTGFEFYAGQGVRLRYWGTRALPDRCDAHEYNFQLPLEADSKPALYVAIEAEKDSEYVWRVNRPPLVWSGDDISLVESTLARGYVFDDANRPMSRVRIRFTSLYEGIEYRDEIWTNEQGYYYLENVPTGIQIQLEAEKDGYTRRRRVEVLKGNKGGLWESNRYDFGTADPDVNDFGVFYNGLSDKPEVTSITPGRNASGIASDTPFVLRFSEPMDRLSVERNFGIWAETDETLTVGKRIRGFRDRLAEEDRAPAPGDDVDLIWDVSAFEVNWNADSTEATFRFRDGRSLPTDRLSGNAPDYLVSFSGVGDGVIRDRSGVERAGAEAGFFKLTDGDFEHRVHFAIALDTQAPRLEQVYRDAGGTTLTLRFSEPMAIDTRSGLIAGGAASLEGQRPAYGRADQSPLNADNYRIAILPASSSQTPTETDFVKVSALGGQLFFDAADPTYRSVRLQLPARALDSDSKLHLQVAASVSDPAGNPVAPGQQVLVVTAPD